MIFTSKKRFTSTLLLLIIGLVLSAQMPIEKLDLKKVPQKTIRQFLVKQRLHGIDDFFDMHTTCYRPADSLQYFVHQAEYHVSLGVDKLWDLYTLLSPKQVYVGRRIEFGFLYAKDSNQLIYPGDQYTGLAEGQIQFFSLRLLWGLIKLGLAQEITGINPDQHTLQYCYLKHGKSEGSQDIEFIEIAKNKTLIRHTTHYRSESAFRDRYLYGFFHALSIRELHRNIWRQAEFFSTPH